MPSPGSQVGLSSTQPEQATYALSAAVCLSGCLSVRPSVCLCLCVCICVSVCLSTCLFSCLYMCVSSVHHTTRRHAMQRSDRVIPSNAKHAKHAAGPWHDGFKTSFAEKSSWTIHLDDLLQVCKQSEWMAFPEPGNAVMEQVSVSFTIPHIT